MLSRQEIQAMTTTTKKTLAEKAEHYGNGDHAHNQRIMRRIKAVGWALGTLLVVFALRNLS